MQQLRKLKKILALFLVSLILTIGCRTSQTPSSISNQTGEGRINVGTVLKPRTLDPADSYELASLFIVYNLGETLYSYELGTTNLQPQLASAMPKISKDGLTYIIPLRQGVVFHDDTPFNAQAMVFSLQRFIKNGGEPSFLLADTIETIETTEEYEITIKLKQPFAAFPSLLAFPGACAVSPKAYEIGEGKFIPDRFVGTGAYKLAQMTSDSLRLDVFEKYWGDKPKNQGIDLQMYLGNPANLYNAFRTRAVDVAYQSLLSPQIKKLQVEAKEGKGKVIEASGTAVFYLTLNLNTEPLKDKLVRRAIAALVDRKLLNERILQGQGEPLYSMIPSTFTEYRPVFEKAYGDNNVEKAKQLLQQAGYSKEHPAIVEVWHASSSITASMVATVLKALSKRDLEGAIQFEPNSIAPAAFLKNVRRGLYSSSLANWYPDFLDADNYIYPFLDCAKGSQSKGCEEGGAQNQGSFYYSDRMNQLIDRQRITLNSATRQTILTEIQTILAQEVPYIPLWQSKDYAFAQNNIDGVIINPSQTFPFKTIQKN